MTDEKIIKFFTRRLFLFFSFKIFLFFVLVSRLFYLQIIKHKYFLQKSNSNSLRKIQIPLKRGSIFDSNERLLAASVKVYVVFVKLDKIQDPEEFFKKYEKIFELNQEEKKYFKKSLNEFLSFDSSFFIQINKENSKKNLNKSNLLELKTISFEKVLIAKYNFEKFDDIYFIEKNYRIYPRGEFAFHIVGYLNNNIKKYKISNFSENLNFQNGVCGIEKEFDEKLLGRPKTVELVVNAFGKKISETILCDGLEGQDVYSSINSDLQERILNFFKERGGKTGSVVVSEFDEKTYLTKILACVSAPSFDPNFFSEPRFKNFLEWEKLIANPEKPLINKAISGIYSPGSIFKIFIALAALEQGLITKNTKIFCDGGHLIGGRFFTCLGRHGLISISDAIKFSCNTFFYALSKKINIEKFFEFGKLLGMGSVSNLNLHGEKAGILPNETWKKKRFKDFWRTGDSANFVIGQGYVALNTLQFNRMMSSIASGFEANFSLIAKPELDELNKKNEFFIPKKIASEENLKIVRHAMFRGANEVGGTSFRSVGSKLPHLRVCGKTGTVQIFSKKDTGFNHSTFLGFAPFEKPRFIVSIVGEYCGYGAQFAGPLGEVIFNFLDKNIKK